MQPQPSAGFRHLPPKKPHNSSFRLMGSFKPPRLVTPTAGAWDPISRCSSSCRPWILVHALRKVRRVAAALDGVGPWIFWIHRGPSGKSTIVGGDVGGAGEVSVWWDDERVASSVAPVLSATCFRWGLGVWWREHSFPRALESTKIIDDFRERPVCCTSWHWD